MTLDGYFTLNSILRRYVYSSEAWLSEISYSETCSECRRTLKRCASLNFLSFLLTYLKKSLSAEEVTSSVSTEIENSFTEKLIKDQPQLKRVATLPCEMLCLP